MAIDDIHARIFDAVAGVISSLDLGGTEERIYIQLVPDITGVLTNTGDVATVDFPAVFLTTEGETEDQTPEPADNESYSEGYPVRVWIADRGKNHSKTQTYLTWRKRIRNAFRDKPLEGVPEVIGCQWTPKIIFDPALPAYEFVVSGFLLTFIADQAR